MVEHCGVNKKAGLLIFSKDNDYNLHHLSMPTYLSPGQPISKPEIISLEDGKLYVFDPEILHGTKLNTSNETRIVVTGRINKHKPKFYADTNEAEYIDWHKANNLLDNKFNKIFKFPRKENSIKKPRLKTKIKDKRNQITIKNNFRRGENLYNFFRNIDFSVPTLIKFKNIHLIVLKTKKIYIVFQQPVPT